MLDFMILLRDAFGCVSWKHRVSQCREAAMSNIFEWTTSWLLQGTARVIQRMRREHLVTWISYVYI